MVFDVSWDVFFKAAGILPLLRLAVEIGLGENSRGGAERCDGLPPLPVARSDNASIGRCTESTVGGDPLFCLILIVCPSLDINSPRMMITLYPCFCSSLFLFTSNALSLL